MAKGIQAFAAEYGNNSFDFTTQGTHFIVVAVIVKEAEKEGLERELEAVRGRYFGTGEIDTIEVGEYHSRRQVILEDLVKRNFYTYCLIVDKQKLFSDGFKYMEPFYKYLCGILYKELYKAFPELILSVDEGKHHFLKTFRNYVYKYHIRDLFFGSEFQMIKGRENKIIQLSEFICGTLARCFDRVKDLSHRETFLRILEPRLSGINYFPREFRVEHIIEEEKKGEYDYLISRYATTLALNFLDTKRIESQKDIDQINCVKLLLLHQTAFGARKFLSAQELIKHLEVGRDKPLQDQQFRATVIGSLRDQGLMIASSAKGDDKGYRFPTSAHDLRKFLDHGNSLVLPILNRIRICREMVKLATGGGLDILEKEEFSKLTSLVEGLK